MAKHNLQTPEPNDLGFGTKTTTNHQRLINRDGQSNVVKKGLPFFRPYDTYLKLITMGWGRFLFLVFCGYLVANIVFAAVYLSLGHNAIIGAPASTLWDEFGNAFLFSSQTISTLSVSRMYPSGFMANIVAAMESIIGLLSFALATGLLYARFSRPVAKILFSQCAVIAPYGEIKAFMFRIANMRQSQLIDTEVTMTLSRNEFKEGKPLRKYYPLTLERSSVPILSMTWTIVHPIENDSPFLKLSYDELVKSDMEVIILIKAFDDTFSQTVHARFSYKAHETVYNARYIPVTFPDDEGRPTVDLSRISEYELVEDGLENGNNGGTLISGSADKSNRVPIGQSSDYSKTS